MSEWKDKSDFEINKAIDVICYPKAEEIPEQCNAAVSNNSECQVVITTGKEGFKVDYCNNPSDAWSIIVENKISIHHDIARYSASSLVYDKKFENGFKVFNYNGEIGDISSRAALRAAMIVYLEMNGVKP